jgi:ABC-type branched-subunit amino acid transport system ATPase component
MSRQAPPLVHLDEIEVRYGGVVAVDRVSFELEAGVIYGLIGPNGSGKSTLLASMSGARRADAGSFHFGGRECNRLPSWKLAGLGLARTFQGTRLIPGMTVWDNVRLGLEWGGGRKSRSERREVPESQRVDRALKLCNLSEVGGADAFALPYGTQRLVEIARAVVAQPKLLLLDEPAAGMHAAEKAEIEDVQRALVEEGVTQLLVEHDLRMIGRVCSWVFVLNSGTLIAQGPPDAVANDPIVQDAYLGKRRKSDAASASL